MPVKRSASSQGGPSPKKAALSVGKAARPKASPRRPPVEGKAKTRPQPVTSSRLINESGTDDEDSEEASFEEVPMDDGHLDEVAPMEVKAKEPKSEAARLARKEALQSRKATKPHNEVITRAKKLWSLARQKSITKEERQKHVQELMDVVRGHVQDIVFKHDASRVIQTLVKLGGKEERNEIALELKGSYKELAQNKYSKFLVTKLIRYCPQHRSSILSEFHSHVLRLLLHREASQVIADAYELYCTSSERALLLQDFYGKEVALFDSEKLGRGGLKAALEGSPLERRRRVLAAVKDNLMTIFNNPDKGAASFSIVHRATWEYLQELDQSEDEAEKERLRRELYDNCQELLAEFVHTRDGSRVVREFLAQGNAKDRKQIIKTLKPHLERICKDEQAQLVLLTALDVVDDTKLLAKSVVSDVTALAPTLSFDKHKLGRRVLLYLLVPRSPRHFPPPALALLGETDGARARTSKKDPQVRSEEVRKAASEDLIKCVEEKGVEMMRDPGASLVVAEIMLYADGDKSAATRTLLKPLEDIKASPDTASEATRALISLPHVSRLYKTLIQGGHFDRDASSVIDASSWSAPAFALAFFNAAGGDGVVEMAQSSGAFLVAELAGKLKGTKAESALRELFTDEVKERLRQSSVKGKETLLEVLDYMK